RFRPAKAAKKSRLPWIPQACSSSYFCISLGGLGVLLGGLGAPLGNGVLVANRPRSYPYPQGPVRSRSPRGARSEHAQRAQRARRLGGSPSFTSSFRAARPRWLRLHGAGGVPMAVSTAGSSGASVRQTERNAKNAKQNAKNAKKNTKNKSE